MGTRIIISALLGGDRIAFLILIELKERNYVKSGRLSPLASILSGFSGRFDENESGVEAE